MNWYRIHLLVLTTLILSGVFAPNAAFAYFSSEGEATDASYEAGTLAIDIDDAALAATIMGTGTSTPDSFVASNAGSLEPQYRITAAKGTCDDAFYNGITVEVVQGSTVYVGPLSSLSATTTDEGEWSFSFAANGVTAQVNDTCELTLTLSAWQENLSSNSTGFTDEKTIDVSLTAGENIGQQPTGNVVLNEIYAAPDTATSTIPLEREWIELYNGSSTPVDVLGFMLNQHTIVSSCTGGANEMQPYGGADTVVNPGELLVIEFCNNGAQNKLSNGGMLLELFDSSHTLVDSYTYPATAELKSHQRIPDGGNWVDPFPTPGAPNVATEAELEAAGWSTEEIDAVLHDDPSHVVEQKETPESKDATAVTEDPEIGKSNEEEDPPSEESDTEDPISTPPDQVDSKPDDSKTVESPLTVESVDDEETPNADEANTGQVTGENDSTGANS